MTDSREHRLVFACESGGFESTVDGSLLGGFDGTDRREVMLYAVRDKQEQLLVSMHELLHHELHWSTAWGLIAAMSGLLALAGIDVARLGAVAVFANNACRDVHEIFATTVSSGVIGVENGRALLIGNNKYLNYLERGLSLGGDAHDWPWQFRESAIQTLLRLLMQPAALASVAEVGFEQVVKDQLAQPHVGPDDRLRLVYESAPQWWQEVFTELRSSWPNRGGDRGGQSSRELPADPGATLALKQWEETILIPTLQAAAHERFESLGLPVLNGEGYADVVAGLRESFVRLAPDDWQVEVFADRRGLDDEPLGAERESAVLHARPATAVLRMPAEFAAYADEFKLSYADTSCVVVLYFPLNTLHRQFGGVQQLPTGEHAVLAMTGAAASTGTQRSLPIAVIRPDITPAQLVDMFATFRAVVLTSLRVTRDADQRNAVLDLGTVFVLIDIPLRAQVANWIAQDLTPRFRVFHLGADVPVNLVVFRLDELPMCWFLSYRSDAGFGELARLFDEYEARLQGGLEVSAEIVADIGLLTNWLLGAWWRFEETERS